MGIFSSLFHLNRYMLLARVVIILLILPLHEFAHGWMARRFGDDTAEANGRLTLNPLMHLDPLGSVLLLFTGFGWAKPVPINPARMNNPRKGIIWTSLAGPFSNLLAALLGVILLQVEFPFYAANAGSAVLLAIHYFLSGFVTVNISLAVFNLIPILPAVLLDAAAPAGAFYCALGSDSDRRTEHTAELPVQLDRAVLSLGDQLDWHAGSDADVIHGENFVSAGGL